MKLIRFEEKNDPAKIFYGKLEGKKFYQITSSPYADKIEFIDETRYEQVLVHWDKLDYEDHGTPADMGYIGRIREWINVNNLEVAQ